MTRWPFLGDVSVEERLFSHLLLLILGGLWILFFGIGPGAEPIGARPDWAETIYGILFFTNVLVMFLMFFRGLTPAVSGAVTVVGIVTILGSHLIRTLSTADPLVLFFTFLGLLLGGVGLSYLDPAGVTDAVQSHRQWLLVTGLGLLGGEILFGLVSTALWLLPLLWATLAGAFLLPLVLIARRRWTRQWGIVADIAVVGVVLLFLAPLFSFSMSTAVACAGTWGDLAYSIDLTQLRMSWNDGCNGTTMDVQTSPVIAGTALVGIGTIGTYVFEGRMSSNVDAE